MFRIKRLYTFVLSSFFPVFIMTFAISNFILVMQFVWRYLEHIVGKGLEWDVLAQFLGYASLSLVPLSLPLAILLASLMTFGNLGEKLELLAMKAAGISLFHIMRPLIVLMLFVVVGAFFFQDRVQPKVQLKLTTLVASFKQKSPELSIPEGAFYSEIPGVTIHVSSKNADTRMLHDVMIYDFSNGYENAAVTLADSARLRFTDDKKNLVFTLYNGEGFSNFNNEQGSGAYIPYRREMFSKKELVIDYDANFNMVDESNFASANINKNTKELGIIIDSVGAVLDSLGAKTESQYTENHYFGREYQKNRALASLDSIKRHSLVKPFYPKMDSLVRSMDQESMRILAARAKRRVSDIKNDLEYKQIAVANETYQYRRCGIEYHRKFTLSFACLIFFFIGAPLGAIIRKGGIGVPALVSVVLFIVYYMVDIAGYKLARDGVWEPALGGWLSSAVLLPLGLFLTYKAVNDSQILNADAYFMFFMTWLNPKRMVKHALVAIRKQKRKRKWKHSNSTA